MSLLNLIIFYIGISMSLFTLGLILLTMYFIYNAIKENDWNYKKGFKYNPKYLIGAIITIPTIFVLTIIIVFTFNYCLN